MVNKIVGIILNLLVVNLFSNTCVTDMRKRRRSLGVHVRATKPNARQSKDICESQRTRFNDFNELANVIANLAIILMG